MRFSFLAVILQVSMKVALRVLLTNALGLCGAKELGFMGKVMPFLLCKVVWKL